MNNNFKSLLALSPLAVGVFCGGTTLIAPNVGATASHNGVATYSNSDKDCDNIQTLKPKNKESKIPGFENNNTVNSIIKDSKTKWVTSIDCGKVKGAKASYQASRNWSGMVAKDSHLKSVNFVETNYSEPQYKTTLTTSNGVWAGIGGASGTSGSLIQDGTFTSTTATSQQHNLFFEVYPNFNVTIVKNIPVNVGDKIYVSSAWANNTATFVLCNRSSNICTTVKNADVPAPGGSAEWIVEKVTDPGATDNLANYGSVTFTGNNWEKNSSGTIIHKNISSYATPYVMVDATAKRALSAPGDINPTTQSFTDYWKAFR